MANFLYINLTNNKRKPGLCLCITFILVFFNACILFSNEYASVALCTE